MKLTKRDKENIGYCLYYLDLEYDNMTKKGRYHYDELCQLLQFPIYNDILAQKTRLALENHRINRDYVPRQNSTNVLGGPIIE